MKKFLLSCVAIAGLAGAAEKHAPMGHVEDDNVGIDATVLTADEVKAAVESDFGGIYTVLEVKVSPKGSKPYDVRLDEFILRSESNGDHSGPMLAGQVAGTGALVVDRKMAPRSSPEMPQMPESMKVEMKQDDGKGGNLELVKKKMLAEEAITAPETGLLFFPLEKQKPKNLVLSCATPSGKLRLQFK